MSLTEKGPDAQDSLFVDPTAPKVPEKLARATFRLEFPPSYALVGVYRLCTDPLLYKPAWEKCRNGTRRGALVGLVWTVLTFGIQKKFYELFLSNSPKVTGLSNDTIFGYQLPFSVQTYATFLLVGSQFSFILRFFLARNINVARTRVYAQTVASRGYSSDFWQPYVEERENPPRPKPDTWTNSWWLTGTFGRMVIKRIILLPFNFYPIVGIVVSAWLKALGTAQYLHKTYFAAKRMSPEQTAVFIEERKWDYRTFGFVSAVLEGLPFIGLFFTVSNQVGAAMWAHDLEKRQHFVRDQKMGKVH